MPIDKYRPDIDGIRALAVLSVFCYHLNPGFLPGGFLGVDIFFIISGYLITGIIVRENRLQAFRLTHFYARRVKRLFPALFVVLFLSGLVATLSLIPETYLNFVKSARYASGQVANIFFARKIAYFDEGFSEQPLLNTWSLGVEEQFYLFWPFIVFACFKLFPDSNCKPTNNTSTQSSEASTPIEIFSGYFSRSAVVPDSNVKRVATAFLLIFLVSFSLCYILAETDYNLAFYMFYSRAFEFCIGGFLSLGLLPRPTTRAANSLLGASGLFLIIYSLHFIENVYLNRSFLQLGVLIPCIGTALIIHADWKIGIANKVLATRVPVAIGKISYSLYLYHWPAISFWKSFSNTNDLDGIDSFGIVVLTFFLSMLSYYFVEKPARQSRLSDIYVLIIAVSVVAGFAICFKHMEQYKTASWRIAQYGDMPTAETARYDPGCTETWEKGLLIYECRSRRTPDDPFIALIGDSHALHYLWPVTVWARKNGYNVKYLGAPACPMLLDEIQIISSITDAQGDKCAVAMAPLQSQIIDDPNVELILIAQRFDLFYEGKGYTNVIQSITFRGPDGKMIEDHAGYYRDGLVHTIETIEKAGKIPVFLKQVPIFGSFNSCDWEPLIKKLIGLERSCDFDVEFIEEWQRPSIDFLDELAANYQVEVFDPMPYFSNPLIDGFNIYTDRDHLNQRGSLMLTPHFEEEMDLIAARAKRGVKKQIR